MTNINPELFKPKQRVEIIHFIKARQKTFSYSTEIYVPNKPYPKLDDGYEPTVSERRPSGNPIPSTDEEKLDRSIRYTRSAVKDITLSNDFDLFCTFTFKNERSDHDLCKSKMSGWLKRQRKQDKAFQYIVIPEFHKDQISLHFHALIAGYKGKIVRAINPDTNKPLVKKGRKVYDFPNYTLGHSEVYRIGDTELDHIKSGHYIAKYVQKNMPIFGSKKRFWASRNLKKPTIIDNPNEWYFGVVPSHMIETDFGKFLYFDNKNIKEYL